MCLINHNNWNTYIYVKESISLLLYLDIKDFAQYNSRYLLELEKGCLYTW